MSSTTFTTTTMLAETVLQELEELRQHAERVAEFLAKPDHAALLAEQLHNPDELPRKDLWQTCAGVVDSLDRVQLIISPSVSLLADCFFGKARPAARPPARPPPHHPCSSSPADDD